MKLKQQLESIVADEQNVEKTINAAAGVIMRIGDNNRTEVLLIQRAADDHWPLHWEFPRGKCDKPIGEDLVHCMKREVKEETGLDVIPVEKIDVHEYLAEGGKRKTFCHNYLCMLKNPDQKVKLSKEHDSFKWITEMGEVELMVMPEQKKTLEKIFHNERSIVSYPHDNRNQTIEEYINYLNEDVTSGILAGTKAGAAGLAKGGLKAAIAPSMIKVYFGAMIAKMAYDFYQKNYSKLAKQCKGLPSDEKTICMLHAKARAKKAEVNKLKGAISKCAKAKNPEKCKATLQNKANQANATMTLSLNRAKQLKTRR